jgi:predicted ribosome quality control (RQC) complex YloA/Tae2 family protein
MKKEIASLELFYLVKELQELVGAKFDRIFEEGEDFYFQFFAKDKGKKILKISPNMMYLTEFKPKSEAGGFCSFLRRRLSNARVKSFKQYKFERIVEIEIDAREQQYIMMIELFNIGNIILCDQNRKIISPYKNKSWSARTIRGGIPYEFPPEQNNVLSFSKEEFIAFMDKHNDKEVVKILAKDLSLGGNYAEDICHSVSIDKNTKLSDHTLIGKVFTAVKNVFEQEIRPCYYQKRKEIVPFMMKSLEQPDKEFKTFNEALDEILTERIFKEKEDVYHKEEEEKLNKTQKLLKVMEDQLRSIENDYAENTRKGQLIYEHYQEVEELLKYIHQEKKKKEWPQLKKEIMHRFLFVKEINEKDGNLIIEF